MGKIFFIADTHFGHEKIIKLCNRPFENLQDMQNQLIQKWNNKVSNEDTVYILGDFCFKMSKQDAVQILNMLNGKKVLIKGNHDKYVQSQPKLLVHNSHIQLKHKTYLYEEYICCGYGHKSFLPHNTFQHNL